MIDGYTTSRGFVPMKPRRLVWMPPGLGKLTNGRIDKQVYQTYQGFEFIPRMDRMPGDPLIGIRMKA